MNPYQITRRSLPGIHCLVAGVLAWGALLLSPQLVEARLIDADSFVSADMAPAAELLIGGSANDSGATSSATDPAPAPVADQDPSLGDGMGVPLTTPETESPSRVVSATCLDAVELRVPMLVVWLSHQPHLIIPPAPRSGLLRPPKSA